jgi:carboxymethylenebutenolidase
MAQSRTGTNITLTTDRGEEAMAYVSGPQDARRGVLVLHEWWGLRDHNKAWVDRFAEQGYRALVVDLYGGRITNDAEEAGRWMREIDQDEADRKLRAALGYLAVPGRKLAVYGCSFGGREAMQATLLDPAAVAATVIGYCRMETDVDKLKGLQGPVLAIYAERERNWPEKQQGFEAAMAEAGKLTEGLSFNASHGFTNPTSPRYDAGADKAVWRATFAFLDKHLAP